MPKQILEVPPIIPSQFSVNIDGQGHDINALFHLRRWWDKATDDAREKFRKHIEGDKQPQ